MNHETSNGQPHTQQAGQLPKLVKRTTEYEILLDNLTEQREHAIYLYGPHGAGKTLLVRHALRDLAPHTTVCYLSGRHHDTQYKVLAALCETLTGDKFTTGYHTAQLYTAFTRSLADHDLVIVLDDIDFLLLNDGSDLLYYLSRLDPQYAPRLVMVSANHRNLSAVLDGLISSSLRPATISLAPYTEPETVSILETRIHDWVTQDVTMEALAAVAATSQNIRLGRDWLTLAAEITDGPIREDIIQLTRVDAQQRYRANRLAAFSVHHRLLMQVIEQLAAEPDLINSGAVYEWYQKRCTQLGRDPLSTRRISDYLKHLECLGLIQAEYHYGGHEGKTRHIQLQEV